MNFNVQSAKPRLGGRGCLTAEEKDKARGNILKENFPHLINGGGFSKNATNEKQTNVLFDFDSKKLDVQRQILQHFK